MRFAVIYCALLCVVLCCAMLSYIYFRALQGIDLLKQILNNHLLHMLGIRAIHNAAGWCLCGALWSTFSFSVCYLFFLAVLNNTSAIVPAFSLLLCGLSLGMPQRHLLSCHTALFDSIVYAILQRMGECTSSMLRTITDLHLNLILRTLGDGSRMCN